MKAHLFVDQAILDFPALAKNPDTAPEYQATA
jgi:hypothetical protein